MDIFHQVRMQVVVNFIVASRILSDTSPQFWCWGADCNFLVSSESKFMISRPGSVSMRVSLSVFYFIIMTSYQPSLYLYVSVYLIFLHE